MKKQRVKARYFRIAALIAHLQHCFGDGNYKIKLQNDCYVLSVPRRLTDDEIISLRYDGDLERVGSSFENSISNTLRTVSHVAIESKSPEAIEITALKSAHLDSFFLSLSHGKIDVERASHHFRSSFSDVFAIQVPAREQDHKVQRTIAIKVMKPNTEAIFEAESMALTRLARLEHKSENVIQLIAEPFNRNGERAFFLPLADFNLEQLLLGKQGNTLSSFTPLWKQLDHLVDGLASIHQEKIFHGDLKPENILVHQEDGGMRLIIADFGHSKCDDLTATYVNFFDNGGAYPLSPVYSPPEVWNQGVISLEPCDVWALGCILLELSVYLQRGHQGLQVMRDLRQSEKDRLTIATFHDFEQLKPEIREYIQTVGSQTTKVGLRAAITGMLQHDPAQRWTAAFAYEELSGKHYQQSEIRNVPSFEYGIREFCLSVMDRAHRLAVNSNLPLVQVITFFAAPILICLSLVVLAATPSLCSRLLGLMNSAGFIILVTSACVIFSVANYRSIGRLTKRVRILLSLDAECPFPACRSRTGPRAYRYPQQWLNHLGTTHSAADQSEVPAMNQSTSSAKTSSVGLSTSTVARVQSKRADTSIHGEGPSNSRPLSESNVVLALDLCLPEHSTATKAIHLWQFLDFNPTWLDQKLFQNLAEKYFSRTSDALILPYRKLYIQFATWFSFTRLSRVCPTRFYIIEDYMGNGNKALCHEHVPSETVVPILLTHYSTQQYQRNNTWQIVYVQFGKTEICHYDVWIPTTSAVLISSDLWNH
ncbi:kinase-like domain-containing protein [Pestalotiopsis sp. NC0098]|nr:kinase-like domain-containing protein [Pestalotiopsis sp. NC0098]